MSFTGVVTDTPSWPPDYCTAAPDGSPASPSSSSRSVTRSVARAAPSRAVIPVEPGHLWPLRLAPAVAAAAAVTTIAVSAGPVAVGRRDSQ